MTVCEWCGEPPEGMDQWCTNPIHWRPEMLYDDRHQGGPLGLVGPPPSGDLPTVAGDCGVTGPPVDSIAMHGVDEAGGPGEP